VPTCRRRLRLQGCVSGVSTRNLPGSKLILKSVTPGDIIKDNQDTTPFRQLTDEEYKNSRARNFAEVEIEAIFVFADSRDWAADQQIILDLLMSKNGHLGTRSENFDEGPPLFFSHNDVVWSASHDLTRIGMGALRVSLEAMFKAVTGKELETTAFGKPQIGTFEFATRLLQKWRKDTLLCRRHA
jgi:ribonucleotide monophosphatase NagD (HAD superfamily)